MKSRHIFFLLTGLLSFGAAAQVGPPASNRPAAAAAVPGITFPAVAAPATNAPAEKPDKGQFSHALGVYYGQLVTNDMVVRKAGLDPHADLDLGKFFEAFSNEVVGVPMSTNMEELRKILAQEDAYQKQRIDEEVKKLTATGPENKVKGEKFMDDIAKQPGMIKLASGVVYKVIKDGDGEKPASTDAATVSFQAKKIDGTEVWKIEHQGIPVTHQLIPPGLTEAMTLMKAGSHWTVYLPYIQAYGEKPAIADPIHGYKVGPESALIFDVELEAVQKRPPLPPTRMPPGMMPPAAPTAPTPGAAAPSRGATASPVVTSGIVRVPSAEEMEKGDKPRVMTDAEIEALKKGQTNAPTPK
jgi:FKBP-type peptidyl-prolyl cis-trans isomerase